MNSCHGITPPRCEKNTAYRQVERRLVDQELAGTVGGDFGHIEIRSASVILGRQVVPPSADLRARSGGLDGGEVIFEAKAIRGGFR